VCFRKQNKAAQDTFKCPKRSLMHDPMHTPQLTRIHQNRSWLSGRWLTWIAPCGQCGVPLISTLYPSTTPLGVINLLLADGSLHDSNWTLGSQGRVSVRLWILPRSSGACRRNSWEEPRTSVQGEFRCRGILSRDGDLGWVDGEDEDEPRYIRSMFEAAYFVSILVMLTDGVYKWE
jgi:hypothetical protein